ncbi:MAG: DUF362 domain-containing protein, partial [Burkholderiales bacterium]
MQRVDCAPEVLLEQVIERGGLWQHIARVRGEPRRNRDRRPFVVIIKPDLDFFAATAQGGTEPALVEHLVDLLHDRGYTEVVVGEARSEDDRWLLNRESMIVPDLVGYRFVTAKGRRYEVVNLRPEADAGADSDESSIRSAWREANYRINFAKNKTHEESLFALCVHNLGGLAPRRDADGCLTVLRTAAPHFNLIDAITSAHGGAGQRAPRPLVTSTLIASTDALLADWAGAARMGLDPYAAPANALALRSIGLPTRHQIDCDLSPYPLWRNVHSLYAHSARQRNRGEGLGTAAAAWVQSVDRERFPVRDFYTDRINALVAPLIAQIDDNPRSFWLAIGLNAVLARIDGLVQAQNTLFSKDRLRRRVAPLTIDPASYSSDAYDAIAQQLAPYEQLIRQVPPNSAGLRWRLVDGAVVFFCEHVFPITFAAFTRRVDITRSIQYMNDYIGGSTIAVRRNGRGKVVHQAERNLYLQQPNWMVLLGGEVIDVEKIQAIRYGRGHQTIHGRTVNSPNGSAYVDDGSVSFIRTADGYTRVQVFARQR